ncbi:DMT family transporter [Ralstonia solanacearum]|uniref:DMT family transporter n=1 Tax=Ralstonia solanacearum TaxID=305 RepID=UPI000449E9E4|nr:transporter [Ralstonia solanacearum P673]
MHTIRDMKLTTPISSASTVDPHAIRNERIGTLLMVFGGIVLGTIGIFIEEAGQDPVTTVLFRCGFGGVALLLWGLMEGRIAELRLTGRALRSAIAAGLLMVVNWGLFFAAIPRTSIAVATVIFHVQPFWVIALGAWLLRERISAQRAAATAIALFGLVLATGLLNGGNPLHSGMAAAYWSGVAMCLGGSVAYAGVTLIARMTTQVSPFAQAWWQCLVGVAVTSWWPFVHGVPGFGSAWGWLAGMGVIHTGLAYAVLYAGMSRLRTGNLALLQFVYPLTAILVDRVVYGHTLSPMQIVGMSLMAASLWSVKLMR